MTTVAQQEYANYLRSPRWRIIRYFRRRWAGNRCQLCNSPIRPEAHHRSYQNTNRGIVIGMIREWRDTFLLCHDCHSKHHGRKQ